MTAVVPPEADYVLPNNGPRDSHRFRVTVHSCMASGVVQQDGSVGDYRDADWWDVTNTVEVRASSLVEALEKAGSEVPFVAWVGGKEDLRRIREEEARVQDAARTT